jgi:streptogramin lyase
MATDPTKCEVPLSGTVSGAELPLNHPMDVVLEKDGSFVLAAWHNHKIEHFDAASGDVSILAGGQKPGPGGDGGPATAALLNFPASIVEQSDGGLLISDERTNRVRRISPDDGTISRVAGMPPPPPPMMPAPMPPPPPPAPGSLEDGVPATTAQLALTTADKLAGADNPPPGGAIALGDDGTLFIADTFHHCIRSVSPGSDGVVGTGAPEEETITTVAGTCGTSGYDGDGGSALEALLNQPFDIEIGPDGALYIADTENHVVRKVDLDSHQIDLVAGTGQKGYSGEALPATKSKLYEPYGLAFDPDGTLFIVDTMNNRIREIVR